MGRVCGHPPGRRAAAARRFSLRRGPDCGFGFRFMSRFLLLPGLLALAVAAHAQRSPIVQTTLNPLPASVLIPASAFTGTHLGTTVAPRTTVLYSAAGDLTGDGYPEVIFTGWTYQGFDAVGTPPPAPLIAFSLRETGAVPLDPQRLLGVADIPGTSTPRILDLNRDRRNDFLFLGHNESPLVPTPSARFLQNADGTFSRAPLAGPRQESHNSSVGDYDGDGYPDILASSYRTEDNFFSALINRSTVDGMPPEDRWGYLTLYLNDRAGNFSAIPFVQRTANNRLTMLGSGSSCAMGDLDGDGKPEFVIVDSYQTANNYQRPENFILTNLEIAGGLGRGDLRALPLPYFDRDGTYAAFRSQFANKSHNIQAEIVDVNNDGRPDIIVSVMLWEATAGTQGGVFQVLRNEGNLRFTDITDTALHNFFLGASGSHQPQYLDVNGDGFVDILATDPYGGASVNPDGITWSTDPKTWATRLLINTGSGKFVQAMWDEFREHTLAMREIAGDPRLSQYDNAVAFYLLPDRRLGYLARQATYTNEPQGYVSRVAWFDFRARARLSTGPRGADPAAQGAPGFSEYFYLTEYPEVAAAVQAGRFASGLAHYLAEGRARGLEAFAPNARIAGTAGLDTVTLTGPRSRYQIAPLAGGYAVTDVSGRHGRLVLESVERIQFSDALVDPAALPAAWLSNLSVRATLPAEQPIIVGVSTQGGAKPVLLRAVGPTLAQFGLASAMPDPRLEVYRGEVKTAENDNWSAALAPTFSAVGAFGFGAGSRDAALLASVDGSASVQAKGAPGGAVLVEAYDALPGNAQRLVNVSARNHVGTDADILIAGFSIGGTGDKRLLIRAIGPGLTPFGVSGALSDPRLELYDGATKIAENDNWAPALASTFTPVGAFALASGSRDAAITVTVSAGKSYTVQVAGVAGATGEALIEIYEVP